MQTKLNRLFECFTEDYNLKSLSTHLFSANAYYLCNNKKLSFGGVGVEKVLQALEKIYKCIHIWYHFKGY